MPQGVDVHIRAATPADMADATRIIRDALAEFGLTFDPEGRDADVKKFGVRPDHDDVVAVESTGSAIGVASLGPQGSAGVGWLSKMFVDATARKRGVGRALLEAVHAAAARRGYRTIGLRTRLVFVDAIALYERAGYRPEEAPATTAPTSQRVLDGGDRIYWITTPAR